MMLLIISNINSYLHANKYMKTTHLLLTSGLSMCSDKIIKNINVPSCKNCIYYKPRMFDSDFTSTLNICEKFGNKNIITDKITYDYADLCRQSDTKCGEEGKYFTPFYISNADYNIYVFT
jgi:hypothetical protein